MKRAQKWLALWASGAAALLTALALTSATYAWFSSNREVETDRVTGRTGSDFLELQISNRGGADFVPMKDATGTISEAPLRQSDQILMPVSTADLRSFVYCPFTVDGNGVRFLPVEDESLYYHDTVYLRAVAEGMPEGARMALYLDNTLIVEDVDGELLIAARLGLTFDGENPVIFALSEVNEGTGNSRPDGVPLEPGKVLVWQNGRVVPADDPAILPQSRQLSDSGTVNGPPLAFLELNRIYAVDVYFYLEGCDPDCLDQRVGRDEAVLQLAFFGMLEQ